MKLADLKKFNVPDKPGVYFFLQGREILYIGKATSLKSRVRSYFGADLIATRGPITVDMVFKADSLKWETTETVLEALILEANLIKKHQPYHNIKEKDNKSFNYVVFTRENLPKILVIRARELNSRGSSVFELPEGPARIFSGRAQGREKRRTSAVSVRSAFGPFTSGSQLREALKIIRRIFPFIDASSSKKQNYQFYKQLGLTPDVEEPNEAYLQNIHYLKLFFKGKKKDIIRQIKREMLSAAKERKFERAQELKMQLFALRHINDVALLKEENYSGKGVQTFRIESYDIAHMGGKNMVGVMTVVEGGQVQKNEYRKFKIRTQDNANDTGALREVVERRLNHLEWRYPNLIVVDGGKAQINAITNMLKKSGIMIPVVSVLKDERHKPKDILGDKELAHTYEREILLSNSEAHRFAIAYHKNMRGKTFLPS